MKTPKIICTVAALAFSITTSQAVETDPVGFVSVTVAANSDAVLAVPLNRASEFKGVISSISGNLITVTGTPGWTANQFVFNGPLDVGTDQIKTYAIQIASGTKEGLTGFISANGTNTLTVVLDAGEDLTGVLAGASGDQIDILPYWTPASVFTSLPASGVELYLFPTNDAGVNHSPGTIYELAGTSWLNQDTGAAVGNSPLAFGQAFVLRNGSASSATVSMVGSVPMSKHRILLRTLAADTPQDSRIGYLSPIPEAIGSVGLGTNPGDELHVFDNSAVGINKSPVTILEFTGTAWLNQDSGANVNTSFMMQPGQGYLLRRVGTASPSTVAWSDLQSYLSP